MAITAYSELELFEEEEQRRRWEEDSQALDLGLDTRAAEMRDLVERTRRLYAANKEKLERRAANVKPAVPAQPAVEQVADDDLIDPLPWEREAEPTPAAQGKGTGIRIGGLESDAARKEQLERTKRLLGKEKVELAEDEQDALARATAKTERKRAANKKFQKDLELGALGERRFADWVAAFEQLELEDLSGVPEFQKADVDFRVRNTETGQETLVEVKTDSYSHTGNLFLETQDGGDGWFRFSKADVLVYYFVNGLNNHRNNAYFINLPLLRQMIDSGELELEARGVNGSENRHGNRKRTKGYLLPVEVLRKCGALTAEYAWETAEVFVAGEYRSR